MTKDASVTQSQRLQNKALFSHSLAYEAFSKSNVDATKDVWAERLSFLLPVEVFWSQVEL